MVYPVWSTMLVVYHICDVRSICGGVTLGQGAIFCHLSGHAAHMVPIVFVVVVVLRSAKEYTDLYLLGHAAHIGDERRLFYIPRHTE